MVDRLLNGLIVFLVISIGYGLYTLIENANLLRVVTEKQKILGPIPRGWVEVGRRWTCHNVDPHSIHDVLKALRGSSTVPQRIYIEPPFAEVVWQ